MGKESLVYAVWTDLTGESGCDSPGNEPGTNVASRCKTRVYFSSSVDNGNTWLPDPIMINRNPGQVLSDQFHPRLVVDETNGRLVVVYYTTEADSNRLKTIVMMQTSEDEGAT